MSESQNAWIRISILFYFYKSYPNSQTHHLEKNEVGKSETDRFIDPGSGELNKA